MQPGQPPATGAPHDGALLSVGAQTAVAAIRAGGRLVTVGMGCDHARLPVSEMTFREVTLAGSFRYANTVRACRTPHVVPVCMPAEKMRVQLMLCLPPRAPSACLDPSIAEAPARRYGILCLSRSPARAVAASSEY